MSSKTVSSKIKLTREERARMARERQETLRESGEWMQDRERQEIQREIDILLHPTNDAYFVNSNYVRSR